MELEVAIVNCLKLSPADCSKGPHGPIGSWDVSAVDDMRELFNYDVVPEAIEFIGDISKWDVSRVTNMKQMFAGASSFAQILCGVWQTSTANKHGMFDGSSGSIFTTTTTAASNSKTTSMKTLTPNPDCDPKCWAPP